MALSPMLELATAMNARTFQKQQSPELQPNVSVAAWSTASPAYSERSAWRKTPVLRICRGHRKSYDRRKAMFAR
jgi:hypothetical protein